METPLVPRLIRAVPPQLGTYIRPNRADHKSLLTFLANGAPAGMDGIVFDPALADIHDDLIDETHERKIDAVLDPRAMEMALPGGFVGTRRSLPWAGDEIHRCDSLRGSAGRECVKRIVDWLEPRRFSSILAPSHYLADGASDPWFDIDRELTIALREALDSAGLGNVPIYYPLAIKGGAFFESRQRAQIHAALSSLPIDAIWLRVHPFCTRSGGNVVRKFIRACADLHPSALPLVAEKSGTTGLALLAFGAVGAIESGVTLGEHFDANTLISPRESGKPFAPDARVYIPELQTFLTKKQARPFFENRGIRTFFACKEDGCCPPRIRRHADPRERALPSETLRRNPSVERASRDPARIEVHGRSATSRHRQDGTSRHCRTATHNGTTAPRPTANRARRGPSRGAAKFLLSGPGGQTNSNATWRLISHMKTRKG